MKNVLKYVYDEGSVGWGLWLLLVLLCAWPGGALFLYITTDTTPYAMRVASGVFIGALAAAIITWLINDILFRLVVRPRYMAQEAEREKENGGEKLK